MQFGKIDYLALLEKGLDVWLGTTYTFELMKINWDFFHHYTTAKVSIIEFLLDWPHLKVDKLLPTSYFEFNDKDALYFEEENWKHDLISFL